MNQNEILHKIISNIIGEKKFQVIEFFVENADENGFIFATILDICEKLDVSKPTVINTIKFLEEKHLLERIKNGLYKINLDLLK